jgi:hypothetical protein
MVEFQQEEAARARPAGNRLTPEEQQASAKRQGLELARARAASDLERATVPAYRRMLEQALAAIDDQLRAL